jgi:hypothetical protein
MLGAPWWLIGLELRFCVEVKGLAFATKTSLYPYAVEIDNVACYRFAHCHPS